MDAIQAYRESEITGDNPVHLVVLLYDQLARDLQRALDALRKHDIERRCEELSHALTVLAQLQGSLNLESGGDVAEQLDRFYNLIRENILRASIEGSDTLLERQCRNILRVREAWIEVERQHTQPAPEVAAPQPASNMTDENTKGSSEWRV